MFSHAVRPANVADTAIGEADLATKGGTKMAYPHPLLFLRANRMGI